MQNLNFQEAQQILKQFDTLISQLPEIKKIFDIYIDFLTEQFEKAVKEAVQDLKPAKASIPVKAPKGTGIPFKLKFFKLDCEIEAVSRAILLIFKGFAEKETMSPSSFLMMVTRSE